MFLKKKNKTKERECRVLFKQKKRTHVKRKVQNKNFFTKAHSIKPIRRKANPRRDKMRNKTIRHSLLVFIGLLLICFTIFGVLYLAINFITSLRGGTSVDDIVYEKFFVEGIESIPVFPNSTFVYEDAKDEEIVLKMLNQGISVYKLPRNTKTATVYNYYEENLPENGWEHISTIAISTTEELAGQYWIKGEKGLRIHIENNDLWYEVITRNEARDSLASRREAELQRKRVLETSSEQKLLPDYPWVLTVPRDFLIKYSSTDIGELQAVEIFEIDGDARFIIYPIGKSNEEPYDTLLHKFLENFEEGWSIVNTWRDFKKEREVLQAKLLVNSNEGEGIVFVNKRNFFIYAIVSNKQGHPFFEEIVNQIYEP